MFNLNGITIAALQVMPSGQTGADYFNYFFTLIVVFGLFSFGINLLVKIISRS
jgi:flagellar biogenesis protein FliO